jgi:hypothetical protein
MLRTKNVPFVGIQGISQLPASQRTEQHVEDMVGFYPTLVDGLKSAPPYELKATLDLTNMPSSACSSDFKYKWIKPSNASTPILLVFTGDATTPLLAYDTTGAEVTVEHTAGTEAYLTTTGKAKDSLNLLFVGEGLLVANSEVQVTELPQAPIPPSWAGEDVASFVVKSVGNVSYNVVLDGTVIATAIAATDTLTQAGSKLAAQLNSSTTGFTATSIGDGIVELVKDDSTGFTVYVHEDSEDYLNVVHREVDKWADLPQRSQDGKIVKVKPNLGEGRVVPYWVVYHTDTGWEEYQDPTASEGFDSSDTPIEITYSTNDTVQVNKKSFTTRGAGNDETNRHPYFVNDYIRGMVFFENRIGYIATEGISWSSIGKHTTLYRETAIETYADDPIHMQIGNGTSSVEIHTATPFHDLVFVETSAGKYVVAGSDTDGFTPTSYSTYHVSSLAGEQTVAPMMVKDKMFFATVRGGHLLISEYSYGDDNIRATPDDVTRVVPRLVPATVDDNVAVDTANTVLFAERGVADHIYGYRYEEDEGDTTYSNSQKTQSAWFKLDKPTDTVAMFGGSDGGVWFVTDDGAVLLLDFNSRVNAKAAILVEATAGATSGEWVVGTWFENKHGADEALEVIFEDAEGNVTYSPAWGWKADSSGTVVIDTDTYGEDITRLWVGKANEAVVTFSEPHVRDQQGIADAEIGMRVNAIDVSTVFSGEYKIQAVIAGRDPQLGPQVRSSSFGDDYELSVAPLTFQDGRFNRTDRLTINNKSQGLNVSLLTESIRPLRVTDARYVYRPVKIKRKY